MPGEAHLPLVHIQGQAGGDSQLLTDQVYPGNQLSDAVLHLDAGVHLHKIKVSPVRVQQKFHRTRVLIVHRLGGPDGGGSHLCPQFRGEAPGGGLLDQLLVAALDRAVPVPQVDHISLTVSQDLELNVAGPQDQLFQIHLVVAEAGPGLRLGSLKGGGQLLRRVASADAPAAPAGGGLQQHRIADLLRPGQRLLHRIHRPIRAGGHRHAGPPHKIPRGGF